MRCISSRVLAPVAAVRVLHVWRRSWRRSPGTPTFSVAFFQRTDQFDRRRRAPFAPTKTSASSLWLDVPVEMGGELGHERGRNRERAATGFALGRAELERSVVALDERIGER